MNHDATVDAREVDFYTRMAESWWDKTGPFWPLHKLNALRTAYIREKLCSHFERDSNDIEPLRGLRVLDVGCGGGILSESMARLGADVTGIDVVEKNIAIATLHARQSKRSIDYRFCTAAKLSGEGARFDVVLNMEVVEHVADVPAFMADCSRLIAGNGVMFVATINRTAKAYLFAIIGAEYVLRWLPRGTHRWRLFQKPAEITKLLSDGALSVLDTVGVAANPFKRSLSLSRSVSVNYMMFCARSKHATSDSDCPLC